MPDGINTQGIIVVLALVCLAIMLVLIFKKQVKLLLNMFVTGAIGLFAAFVMNFVLAPFGFVVGLNAVNFIVIAVLGLPGFLTLYAVQLFI